MLPSTPSALFRDLIQIPVPLCSPSPQPRSDCLLFVYLGALFSILLQLPAFRLPKATRAYQASAARGVSVKIQVIKLHISILFLKLVAIHQEDKTDIHILLLSPFLSSFRVGCMQILLRPS